MAGWTIADIPAQAGRTVVITGATGGLGWETSRALAGAGAEVTRTGRDDARGHDAVARILAIHPHAAIRYEPLDLASLASIAAFAERLLAEGRGLDLLINNAGVMALPRRQTTEDRFERQFGVNYLGHFALTARLLPALYQGTAPQVVSVGSLVHRAGWIDFDDLQATRRYRPHQAYAQSKLAILLFALELQRRSVARNWAVASLAAHPGWARTDLFAKGPRSDGGTALIWRLSKLGEPFLSQSAAAGALPILYAATSPDARPGGYYGPQGLGEMKGPPGPARISATAQDRNVAARLWEASMALTGVRFQSTGG
jgi:NAD(P)-dependent dehydrogenase (short-subunit alcohol dehydrogenase family)